MSRRTNPAASDTTGRTPPKNLRIEFYDEDGDNDPRVERMTDAAWKIAQASPIRILSNKRLSAIAVLGRKVVGAAWYAVAFPWSGDEPGQFSFDIVVAPEAQGKGIGDALVGKMLDQFGDLAPTYGDDEMGGGLVLNVEVVNPAMERILARRGFRLRDEEDPLAARGRTMMTRPNGRPVLRPNGRPVLRPNGRRENPETSVEELGDPTGRAEIPYDRKAYARALAGDMRLQYAHLAGADLQGVTLAGSNLQGANLSYANLSGANLDGVLLDSANLEGANLTGASLKNASLEDVQLFEANLTEANLEGAILSEGRLGNTNFSRANLRKANLYRVGATEATFEGADLEDALLSRAFLTNADFRGARLRNATMTNLRNGEGRFDQGVSVRFDNADLMGADLEDSRFRDANFTNADLSKANLRDVPFVACRFNDADLTRANLRGTRFNGCDMRGAVGTPAERVRDPNASLVGLDFAGLDLRGIDLSGRSVQEASFVEANLVGAFFIGCALIRCDFTGAVLGGANFTSAILREAVFKEARARRANFTKAQMDAVNLDRADVSEANFSDVNLRYAQMLMAVATDANFEYTILTGMKGTQGVFTRARFESAYIEKVDFSGARLAGADFSGAELREVKFNEADLTGARLEDTVVREDVSVVNAKMDAATRALFFVPRSAYGKMAGPILKMDKPDAPTKAAEFKKKYPREFERLKAETGGRDLLPAVKEAVRAKYRSARPWLITRGHYTGDTQRYCGSPNDVLKFNIALDDASFTPAQQDSLRKLAETSRRSGHPHELGDLFTIGWVRYCPDNAERTWLVEEVQSDVSVVRQQLKDEKEFPQQFREVVDILAPIAERFYYDALGVVFELAAEKGYEVEMLDYPAKQQMGSPRSVYTDLPREMGMQKKPKSALEEGAVSGVGAVWAYRPNPKRRRGGRK